MNQQQQQQHIHSIDNTYGAWSIYEYYLTHNTRSSDDIVIDRSKRLSLFKKKSESLSFGDKQRQRRHSYPINLSDQEVVDNESPILEFRQQLNTDDQPPSNIILTDEENLDNTSSSSKDNDQPATSEFINTNNNNNNDQPPSNTALTDNNDQPTSSIILINEDNEELPSNIILTDENNLNNTTSSDDNNEQPLTIIADDNNNNYTDISSDMEQPVEYNGSSDENEQHIQPEENDNNSSSVPEKHNNNESNGYNAEDSNKIQEDSGPAAITLGIQATTSATVKTVDDSDKNISSSIIANPSSSAIRRGATTAAAADQEQKDNNSMISIGMDNASLASFESDFSRPSFDQEFVFVERFSISAVCFLFGFIFFPLWWIGAWKYLIQYNIGTKLSSQVFQILNCFMSLASLVVIGLVVGLTTTTTSMSIPGA